MFFVDASVNRLFIIGASFFCLVSFVLYFLSPMGAAVKENDANGYRKQVECFLKTGHLRPYEQKKGLPIHPPAFPLFVSILYSISNHSVGFVVLVHVLITIMSIFLLMRIALLLFNQQTAKISCLLTSCNLGYLIYAQYLLMEVLVVFLLTFFWERFFRFIKFRDPYVLLHAGLLLGFSLWLKPVALYYGPIVIVFLWFLEHNSWITKVQRVSWFASAFYMPFLILATYNWVFYGAFALSVTLDQNIFAYFIPQIMELKTGIPVEKARFLVWKELLHYNINRTMPGALWYCSKNLFLAIYVWSFNMFKTYFGLYTTQIKVFFNSALKGGQCSFFIYQGPIVNRIVQYCFAGSTNMLLVIIGLFEVIWNITRGVFQITFFGRLFSKKDWYIFSFFLVTFLYFVGITGHDGMARYRMMIEPLLILTSAYSISMIVDMWKIRKKNRYIIMQSKVV